jgi:hypothetical protein
MVCGMPSAAKTSRQNVSHPRTKKPGERKFKAVPGSPLAGLEHLIGAISLPRDPRPRREVIRARILADHNT